MNAIRKPQTELEETRKASYRWVHFKIRELEGSLEFIKLHSKQDTTDLETLTVLSIAAIPSLSSIASSLPS